MNKFATVTLVAAMSLGLGVIPAIGADTGKSVKEKASETKDTVKEKASNAWDKTKEKTSEAWDKTKEKATEAKDKVKEKVSGNKDHMAARSSDEIRQAQQALKDKGHNPGPIDGVQGPRTTAALREYQKAENIKVTGRLDSETKSHLMGSAASSSSASTPSASPSTSQPSVGSPATSTPAAPPASTGSPSAPPQQPEKTQKP